MGTLVRLMIAVDRDPRIPEGGANDPWSHSTEILPLQAES